MTTTLTVISAGQDGVPARSPGELLEVYGRQVDELAATVESLAAQQAAALRMVAGALGELHVVLDELAGRVPGGEGGAR